MNEQETMSAKVLDKLNTPVGLGLLCALALFVMIPVIQAVSTGLKDPTRIAELSFVIPPPPVMEVEAPPPPKKEEKREELEIDKEPPRLSLDQLEMALNPGFSTDSMARRVPSSDHWMSWTGLWLKRQPPISRRAERRVAKRNLIRS